MPKVSIVIRSHNDVEFISDTLKELLAQDFQDFEIISCDDASTDGTAEIIASFPQVIRLERPEGRYVPGKTLNRAIPQCHGDIIVFNNADAVPKHFSITSSAANSGVANHLAESLIKKFSPW